MCIYIYIHTYINIHIHIHIHIYTHIHIHIHIHKLHERTSVLSIVRVPGASQVPQLSGATLAQTHTHNDLATIISNTLFLTIIFTKSLWVWVWVSVMPLINTALQRSGDVGPWHMWRERRLVEKGAWAPISNHRWNRNPRPNPRNSVSWCF